MPIESSRDAVIVATARSPIGRAGKGSLRDVRPDDLAAQMVATALDRISALDRHAVDDVYLGCGLPGGESGFNMARIVNVINGMDDVPGATITRYCASSLQTTRMAFHAIRAGEGTAFVSAGVECVSRFDRGNSDNHPDTRNSLFLKARAHTDARAKGGAPTWHDPRTDAAMPDIYIAMGQTAENVAQLRGITREMQDEFGCRSQNLAQKALAAGFWQREITAVQLPDGRVVDADDGPRADTTLETLATLPPVFRPDGTVTAGNCCPLNDGAAAVVVMSAAGRANLACNRSRALSRPEFRRCRRRSWDSGRSRPRGVRLHMRAWRSATSTWSRSTKRSRHK